MTEKKLPQIIREVKKCLRDSKRPDLVKLSILEVKNCTDPECSIEGCVSKVLSENPEPLWIPKTNPKLVVKE